MKRTIIILLMSLICVLHAFAQEKQSKVILKNGVTMIGAIKELDPLSHITLTVAGFDTRIEMSDIVSIEDASSQTTSNTIPEAEGISFSLNVNEDYPASYNLSVGPYTIEMVLVTGGVFQMGYDGRGSMRMNSEPIHSVQLSSFYVNRSPLSMDLVGYIKSGKEKHNKPWPYAPQSWNDANSIADYMAKETCFPIQLITEAQCEYVLVSTFSSALDISEFEVIYCKDYYEDYRYTITPPIDPAGPEQGQYHVKRYFELTGEGVHTRMNDRNSEIPNSIRLSFPASVLNE